MRLTSANVVRSTREWWCRLQSFLERRIPFVLRSAIGLVFIAMGVVGFLPLVGFWMIPLGLSLIWLDIGPLFKRSKDDDAPSTATDNQKEGNDSAATD